MLKINKLKRRIEDSEKILIVTHQNPDGDALGSQSALCQLLKKMGKNSYAVCLDEIPNLFSFLEGVKSVDNDFLLGDFDLIIILDCGDLKRTGFASRLKKNLKFRKKIINIDHHPRNDIHKIASINIVDYNASSTAEIIFKIAQIWGIVIDSKIATSLLCGIYNDTGGFKHSNTTPEVLKITSELLSLGARLKQITNNITNAKKLSTLKLWGLVLSRIRKIEKLGLVVSVITLEDIKKYQANVSDLAGVVNLINTIPDSSAAILFYEIQNGKIKASLRTEKNNIDVSCLARIYGGGGLKKASGFTINGKIRPDGNGGWKIADYKI